MRGTWLHLSFPLFCRTLTQEVGVSKTTLILCLSSVRGTEDTRIISYSLSPWAIDSQRVDLCVRPTMSENRADAEWNIDAESRLDGLAGVMEDGKLDKEGVSGGVKGWHRHG